MNRAKRKRLEVALTEGRRLAREKVAEIAQQEGHSVSRMAHTLASQALKVASGELDHASALAQSPAVRIPEVQRTVAVEALNRATSALVNAVLLPHIALEELLDDLPDDAFDALLDDLKKFEKWKRVGYRDPRR